MYTCHWAQAAALAGKEQEPATPNMQRVLPPAATRWQRLVSRLRLDRLRRMYSNTPTNTNESRPGRLVD